MSQFCLLSLNFTKYVFSQKSHQIVKILFFEFYRYHLRYYLMKSL